MNLPASPLDPAAAHNIYFMSELGHAVRGSTRGRTASHGRIEPAMELSAVSHQLIVPAVGVALRVGISCEVRVSLIVVRDGTVAPEEVNIILVYPALELVSLADWGLWENAKFKGIKIEASKVTYSILFYVETAE